LFFFLVPEKKTSRPPFQRSNHLPHAVTAMLKFLGNLQRFLLRGNIINYVVAIGIGSSFVLVINAFVKAICMPLVFHYVLDDPEVARKKVVICEAKEACSAGPAKPEVAMQYGLLIEAVLNLVFVTVSLYALLSVLMHFDQTRNFFQGDAPPPPSQTELSAKQANELLREIRDALRLQPKTVPA
jgi:large conductance mechanosensitive channel protein